MLNVGMTELLCFAVIALLVLGPEKLPEGARFAAKWYGKIKKFVSSVQNEIDRELRLSEFRDEMQKEIDKISELERRMQQQFDAMRQANPNTLDASAEDIAQTANDIDTSPLSSQQYHLLTCQQFTPFSKQHIQQHWSPLLHTLEAKAKKITLKIAV